MSFFLVGIPKRFCFCTGAALLAPCTLKVKITRAEKRLSFDNLIDILRWVFVPPALSRHVAMNHLD